MSLREVTRTCKGGLRPSDINVPREQEPVGQGLSADPAYDVHGDFSVRDRARFAAAKLARRLGRICHPFAMLYFVRMPREEQMMSQFFGKTYRDYMRRTNRLCPCFW